MNTRKNIAAALILCCALSLPVSCGSQGGALPQASDTAGDTGGSGGNDSGDTGGDTGNDTGNGPGDTPGNNPGTNPVPPVIYSIVKLWELTETCAGAACETPPYLISFNLDSNPDKETFLTYRTYLQFTETLQVKIYMKIESKTDPYKVLSSYGVGTVLHCAADDETYGTESTSISITRIGSGTFTSTENSLSIVYNDGDSDDFMAADTALISGYKEQCLK